MVSVVNNENCVYILVNESLETLIGWIVDSFDLKSWKLQERLGRTALVNGDLIRYILITSIN